MQTQHGGMAHMQSQPIPGTYENNLQHIALPDGRHMTYDAANMTEEMRAFVEQNRRMQPQSAGRDKVAAQRALGVNAQPIPPQAATHLMANPQNGRPMMAPSAQGYYVDAQGQPVQIAYQPAQRMPNGQYSPAQIQQLQQQQLMQQHHYAQQQAYAAQHHQQQLAAQQRGPLPPSARPPQSAQPNAPSPALLAVPPPPLQRTNSGIAANRSVSPLPPHMRPPPQTSVAMQGSTSAIPIPASPTVLPVRASTFPATSTSIVPEVDHTPTAVDRKRQYTSGTALDRPITRVSAITGARRREDKVTRLQRYIEQAQAQLDRVQKEAEAAEVLTRKESVTPRKSQAKFNELVLEYLRAAGMSRAAEALHQDLASSTQTTFPSRKNSSNGSSIGTSRPDGSPTGEMPSVEMTESTSGDLSLDLRTPADGSPIKMLSPSNTTKHEGGEVRSTSAGPSPQHEVKQEDRPMSAKRNAGDADSEKADKPLTPPSGLAKGEAADVDLGYLYSWWYIFEDVQRLTKEGVFRSDRFLAPTPRTVPPTAVPSSAMATRIAVSAPAEAVRASSADSKGLQRIGLEQTGDGAQTEENFEPPPTAVTRKLRVADDMRKAQQLQIHAQQEEVRRRVALQNGIASTPEGSSMPPPGSQQQAEMQRQMILQQQVYEQQQQQMYHAQMQHQAQVNGQFRAQTPNGTRVYLPMQQHFMTGQVGSPPMDSGGSGKRPPGDSPLDGPGKRPKISGMRPTPEEHARQAMEMAQRAGQGMPIPPGVPQMHMGNTPIQRQMSQVLPRAVSDAERQYAQNQAAYHARQHVMNSPAQNGATPPNFSEASPINHSPSIQQGGFDVGLNGQTTGRKAKHAPSLSLDIEGSTDGSENTPTSAKKKGGKKPAKAAPGSAKTKGTKTTKAKNSIESAEPLPTASTPAHQIHPPSARGTPAQNGDIQYGQPPPGSAQSQHMFQLPQLDPNGNPNGNHGGLQQQQQVQPGPMHVDEDFLKAIGAFTQTNGNEVGGGGDPGLAGMPIDFGDAGFDFDWATANFTNDEGNDWTFPDTGIQESAET